MFHNVAGRYINHWSICFPHNLPVAKMNPNRNPKLICVKLRKLFLQYA